LENWYRIQSALLAAIICAALAIHVMLRGRRNRLFTRFAWFNLNLVAWFLVEALTVSEILRPGLASGAQGIVAGVIPLTCVPFFVDFADDHTGFARTLRRLAYALSIAIVTSAVLAWPADPEARQAAMLAGVFLALVMSASVMIRRFRSVESRVDRARLKVLMLAGLTVFTLWIVETLPGLSRTSIGNILLAVYMFFMFEVITLRRILDLFEFLGRFVVLGGFAIVLSLIYALLVGWWRHDLGLFLLNTTIATIVILILFDPLRNFIEQKLNELVFREKFEFTRQADTLRSSLASIIDVQVLADVLLRRLEESRRVTHASIWLSDEDGLALSNLGYVGTEPPARLDIIKARPFLTRLTDEKLLAVENLEAERALLVKQGAVEDQALVELLDQSIQTMDEIQSALCIGFMAGEQLLGFVSVKDQRLRGAYSTEEIKALVALAAQATITIENSRLFDRIRERDRLAALGEMAAGLAHEIRNPLGAIKGAAQLLEGDASDAANAPFLGIIEEEVNRLNSVVSQFLSYARPLKGALDPVDVNQVLERTLTLLSAQDHTCQVEFVGAPNLPSIRSDPELLRQVVLNLARNAIEAMGEAAGRLTITTALTWRRPQSPARREGGSDRVAFIRIRFIDEGPGIPPEVMERLFIPFFTTKSGGTGLGLAICQRIVRSLGGTIDVSSRVGKGTTFNIYLPASEASPRASVA
jgi:nitrogen-specific signal transduction histidine kinase